LKIKITNISKIVSWDISNHTFKIIQNKDILIESNKISKISNNISSFDKIIDAKQCIVTPGFIDAHTHPIFIGNRSNEFKMRSEGKTYQEISKMGGGINYSVSTLRKATKEELYNASLQNIEPFLDFGTTTIEAKSGYGLSLKDEIKSLEVIKEINENLDIDVIPTFLGAHDIPIEYKDNKEKYIDVICEEMIPKVSELNLAVFCDVFCEKGYFSISESRRILETSKKYNLIPRMHADEFVYSGASELAKEVGAISADHLMAINKDGLSALSNSDTIATLLPGTTFFLNKKEYANGRRLIDNNCNVALATDFNPGTCTIRSLSNIMFLAVQNCGITIEEAFLGVTYNAAKSLNKESEIGLIEENYKADMIFWNISSINEIPYWFDSSNTKINKVIKNGKVVRK
tara:strand:+ start:8910 stop:10118 length:1209 start_codon:yes stop_codon:yes gene_type:complete